MGMGFQFEQRRLELWNLSCNLKRKNNLLRNGITEDFPSPELSLPPPLPHPLRTLR